MSTEAKKYIWLAIRIVAFLIIIVGVTLLVAYYNNNYFLVLYTTIIGIFPGEIKEMLKCIFRPKTKTIRITCSYHFRIRISDQLYMLVDERNNGEYRPVGGVYKFDDNIDVGTEFEAEYDGSRGNEEDTENDIRLVMSRRKLKAFLNWFESSSHRENVNNLTREFKEELIDTAIFPEQLFKKLTYSYVGSRQEKTKDSKTGMTYIRKCDIFNIKLNEDQKSYVKQLQKDPNGKKGFIFASRQEILDGEATRRSSGTSEDLVCKIPPIAKLILVDNASNMLVDNKRLNGKYSANLDN